VTISVVVATAAHKYSCVWCKVRRAASLAFLAGLLAAAPAAAQTPLFTSAGYGANAGNGGYTFRNVITPAAGFTSQPYNITAVYGNGSTVIGGGALSVAEVSVCVQASGTNCAAAPIDLLCGGSHGFTLNVSTSWEAGCTTASPLTFSSSNNLIFCIDVTTDAVAYSTSFSVGTFVSSAYAGGAHCNDITWSGTPDTKVYGPKSATAAPAGGRGGGGSSGSSLIAKPGFSGDLGQPGFPNLASRGGGSLPSPPTFTSAPSVRGITSNSAVVQWTTSTPTGATLSFGTESGGYTMPGSPSTITCCQNSFNVPLLSLAASTKYYYRVCVTDAYGQPSGGLCSQGSPSDLNFNTAAASSFCPKGATYPDGCSGAVSGLSGHSAYHTDFFTNYALQSGQAAYATRPPWNVAGVEYPVGISATTTLKNIATQYASLPPGVAWCPTGGEAHCWGPQPKFANWLVIYDTSANPVIDGWDFTNSGTGVIIDVNDATHCGSLTISNSVIYVGSLVTNTTYFPGYSQAPIQRETKDCTNITVQYNHYVGNPLSVGGANSPYKDVFGGTGTTTFQYNFWDGTNFCYMIGKGVFKEQYDFIQGVNAYSGTHGDWMCAAQGLNPQLGYYYQYNTFLEPNNFGSGSTTLIYATGVTNATTYTLHQLDHNTDVVNGFVFQGWTVGSKLYVSSIYAPVLYPPGRPVIWSPANGLPRSRGVKIIRRSGAAAGCCGNYGVATPPNYYTLSGIVGNIGSESSPATFYSVSWGSACLILLDSEAYGTVNVGNGATDNYVDCTGLIPGKPILSNAATSVGSLANYGAFNLLTGAVITP
jgi:hypothetical protein